MNFPQFRSSLVLYFCKLLQYLIFFPILVNELHEMVIHRPKNQIEIVFLGRFQQTFVLVNFFWEKHCHLWVTVTKINFVIYYLWHAHDWELYWDLNYKAELPHTSYINSWLKKHNHWKVDWVKTLFCDPILNLWNMDILHWIGVSFQLYSLIILHFLGLYREAPFVSDLLVYISPFFL